jgi:hypothetical protein
MSPRGVRVRVSMSCLSSISSSRNPSRASSIRSRLARRRRSASASTDDAVAIASTSARVCSAVSVIGAVR